MRKSIVKNALKTKSAVIIAVIMSVLFISGCGKSSSVSSNDVLDTSEVSTQEETTIDTHPFDITMTFTGDINIAEGEPTTKELDKNNGDITKCISPELIKYMKDADITLVNNEFCYSDRGAPLANKMWTFRAGPERAKVLNALGVDVAQLANNHVYDYGQEAMYDTFSALEAVGIPYAAYASASSSFSSKVLSYLSRMMLCIISLVPELIGWAMSRYSPSAALRLGIAMNNPFSPSMTLISWITNSLSKVMETIAFIFPSFSTRLTLTSVTCML